MLRQVAFWADDDSIRGSLVPIEKKFLLTLWLLATPECFRSVGNLFGMNKGLAHAYFMYICRIIANNHCQYIKWPTDTAQCMKLASGYEAMYGLKGVVGSVDGCHVPIKPPKEDRDSYINRKGTPSINVMAICDSNMSFTYVCADYAGSIHDARIFRLTDIGQQAENNTLFVYTSFHILGDSAYPLMLSLLPPYRDYGNLTQAQRKFNRIHSCTRSVIERAFGRWKGKFRIMKYIDMTRTENIATVIIASMTLHNAIIAYEVVDDECDVTQENDENEAEDSISAAGSATQSNAAKQKRDEIARNL